MNQRGMTIVEVLISTAIVVMIFGFSLVAISRIQERVAIGAGHTTVAHVLSVAARQSRNGAEQSDWGVYFDYDEVSRKPSQFVVFAGSSYATRDVTEDIVYQALRNATLESVSFGGSGFSDGNDHEIIFLALSGSTSQYGTITVESFGLTRVVDVTSEGFITTSF